MAEDLRGCLIEKDLRCHHVEKDLGVCAEGGFP